MIDFLAKALASGLFLSYIPLWLTQRGKRSGAGLVGSIWAVILLPYLPLHSLNTWFVLIGFLAISVVISDVAEKAYGVHDEPRIVIDEFIGYWISIAFLPRSPHLIIAAFVLFRIFDVWKGWGIARWGELPGGWGVVMDDIIAGIYANVCLQVYVALR